MEKKKIFRRSNTKLKMAYPEGYKAVHLRKDIYEKLKELKEFKDLSNQEKINQLIRFYNIYKKYGVIEKC